jgi:hypothetical protein
MMYDLGSMIDFLLLAGLLAIAVELLLWLRHGSDVPAWGLFGMRFDAWSPVVPEEVDPLPWRIELVGEGTMTSRRPTQVRVERPAFSGNQPTLRPSSESAHAD